MNTDREREPMSVELASGLAVLTPTMLKGGRECYPCKSGGCFSLCQNQGLVHVLDAVEEASEQKLELPILRQRTYYCSIFAARVAIMVMLAVFLVLVTTLTWHFSTYYANKTINDLAFNLRKQLIERPVYQMWTVMNSTIFTTNTQVKLAEYVLGQYKAPNNSNAFSQLSSAMRNVTWALFASKHLVREIGITYNNGLVQAFERVDNISNTYYMYSSFPNSTQRNISGNEPLPPAEITNPEIIGVENGLEMQNALVWYKEQLDPITGEGIGMVSEIPSHDVTGDIGNVSCPVDQRECWKFSVSKIGGFALLTSSSLVRHPLNGAPLAVVHVSTMLSTINQLMQELITAHDGYMYLTSTDGLLLATSLSNSLAKNASNASQLEPVTESSNPVIRAGAQWLSTRYGNKMFQQQEIHVKDVSLEGQNYYIDVFFLNLKGLPLVGVIIFPHSYVMGEAEDGARATLAILLPVSAIILVIGCILIFVLTSGVSTEMKLRAEVIKHLNARRRAEASSNYKSQFLANMSHELRTPMAAIIGLLDILLSDEDLFSEQVAMVAQIRRCSTALLRLLNNILDISKVESGKLVLEEADFNLVHELEGLVDMFSVQCVDHDIEIILDLADDIPQLVRGDSARTMQIFANLIANSIKFTSSGCIVVRGQSELSFLEAEEYGDIQNENNCSFTSKVHKGTPHICQCSQSHDKISVLFEVDDTGCGIDPSKWESIFDSFVQADPSTTRTYGGTGLGLCIVRSLVEKMDGEIKVVRKEGPGTLIRMSLAFDRPSSLGSIIQRPIGQTFPSDLDQSLVLVAMRGENGRSALTRWLGSRVAQVLKAAEWQETVAILNKLCRNYMLSELKTEAVESTLMESGNSTGHALQSSTTAPGDHIVDDSLTKRFECTAKKRLPEELEFQENSAIDQLTVKSNSRPMKIINPVGPLALIDVDLLLYDPDSLASSLTILGHFKNQGIRIAWMLNHDTPNAVKTELRKMGYSVMVNKPLYKSKLFMLLSLMIQGHPCAPSDLNVPILDSAFNVQIETGDGLSAGSRINLNLGTMSSSQNVYHVNHQNVPESLLKYPKVQKETFLSKKPLEKTQFLEKEKCHVSVKPCLEALPGRMDEVQDDQHGQVIHSAGKDQLHCDAYNCLRDSKEKEDSSGISKSFSSSRMSIQETGGCLPFKDYISFKHSGAIVSACHDKPPCWGIVPQGVGMDQASSDGVKISIIKKKNSDTLRGIRILLAEDTPVLQRVATMMLEKMGASVVSVGDGLQAVHTLLGNHEINKKQTKNNGCQQSTHGESIVTTTFDLVLMDCQMPRMDGYDATKAIRKAEEHTGHHTPIVALTAHAMSSDEEKCMQVGMDAYLTKPINCKLMVKTILSLTSKSIGSV